MSLGRCGWVLLMAAGLGSAPAHAAAGTASPSKFALRAQRFAELERTRRVMHSIGADYGTFLYQSTGLPISSGGASVFYRARLQAGVALTAGLRFLHVDRLPDGFGIEGYLSVQAAPIIGVWRPLAGFELGATSLTSERLTPEPYYGPEEYPTRQRSLGPAYVGFVVSPLRFALWWTSFSVAGIQIGTHLPQLGSALRLQVLVGQLEWSF